jgi:hypothetical protein
MSDQQQRGRLSFVPSAQESADQPDPLAQLDKSAERWQGELLAMMTEGAEALTTWQEDTGLSQSTFARVARAYLPAEDFKRSIGPSTRSRYRDPRHFWHASLAVASTMVHVSQHSWIEFARVMQSAGDRFRSLQSGMTPAEYDARQDVRRALTERIIDVLPHLTERQLNDSLIYLGIQARENMALRVEVAEQSATPLGAEIPNLEARAAGKSARAELAQWADQYRQRQRREDQQDQREKPAQ